MPLLLSAASQPTSVWSGYWFEVIAFASVFGAFGGIVAIFKGFNLNALMRGETNYVKNRRLLCSALGVGALGGAAGAITVLGVLALDGKFKSAPGDSERLLLCSGSVVAGFLGYRVLIPLAKQLEDRLKQQDDRVQGLQEAVIASQGKIKDQALESAIALGYATANQAKSVITQENADRVAQGLAKLEDAINLSIWRLSEAIEGHPASRTAGIILGRLYRYSGNVPKAIEVLSDVLRAKQNVETQRDKDAAALLFNRACYHALLYKESAQTARPNLEVCVRDLADAISIDPSCVQAAREDKDFDSVRETPDFKRLAP